MEAWKSKQVPPNSGCWSGRVWLRTVIARF
jgi:hypothetical protein